MIMAPAIATATESATPISGQAHRLQQRRADGAGDRADPVGEVTPDQACQDDRRREGGEGLGAVADAAGIQVQHEEGRDRGEADDAQRQRQAGPHRLAGEQRRPPAGPWSAG